MRKFFITVKWVGLAILLTATCISIVAATFTFYSGEKREQQYHDALARALSECANQIPAEYKSGDSPISSGLTDSRFGTTSGSYSRYPLFDKCLASKGLR